MRNIDIPLQISISAGALIAFAALLLLLPIQWVAAFICASIVHEGFHAIAIYLFRGIVRKIHIGATGAVIEADVRSGIPEILCAAAGPIASFSLLLLAGRFPRLAVCGLIHGIYNMLPLFPLDGGRVLRELIYLLFQPIQAAKIFLVIQKTLCIIIFVACALLTIRVGITPFLLGILLIRRYRDENYLANQPFWRYNRSTINEGVSL